MNASIAEAKDRLSQLIRAVERGEQVTITRHGKPVIELKVPVTERPKVTFDGMKDTMIAFLRGTFERLSTRHKRRVDRSISIVNASGGSSGSYR